MNYVITLPSYPFSFYFSVPCTIYRLTHDGISFDELKIILATTSTHEPNIAVIHGIFESVPPVEIEEVLG
jgi:hypothetical protein